MLVSVPLHLDTLPGKPTARDLEAALAVHYYAGAKLVKVLPAGDAGAKDKRLEPEALNGSDVLELRVYASDQYRQAVLVRPPRQPGQGRFRRGRAEHGPDAGGCDVAVEGVRPLASNGSDDV